jgi:hypothetical protein
MLLLLLNKQRHISFYIYIYIIVHVCIHYSRISIFPSFQIVDMYIYIYNLGLCCFFFAYNIVISSITTTSNTTPVVFHFLLLGINCFWLNLCVSVDAIQLVGEYFVSGVKTTTIFDVLIFCLCRILAFFLAFLSYAIISLKTKKSLTYIYIYIYSKIDWKEYKAKTKGEEKQWRKKNARSSSFCAHE